MARIKVRFSINKGRHGAPMAKLGKISEQAEKFLRLLAANGWPLISKTDQSSTTLNCRTILALDRRRFFLNI
jgi:hypothetical protein